jgi:hypothetical protein
VNRLARHIYTDNHYPQEQKYYRHAENRKNRALLGHFHLKVLSRLLALLDPESLSVLRTVKSSLEIYDIPNRF